MKLAEWRFGHGWTHSELLAKLEALRDLQLNFSEQDPGWRRYYSEAIIGIEKAGPAIPGGVFERAWQAIQAYEFSDPGIVVAHFDQSAPLLGRDLLLEIKVLGLHYLCGTRVGGLRDTGEEGETVRGFRYDTLKGHIEAGSEWFLLTKRANGEVWFRIHASWHPGEFPNWWSRAGFNLLGRRYQLAWHRIAHIRLREIVGSGGSRFHPMPQGDRLFHSDAHDFDSDLWILKRPSVLGRVRTFGNPDQEPNPPTRSFS